MLAGRHVLLGVSGGIAAYQAADLVGMLKAEMADVRVVMTRAATRFITPLTLEVVSGNPVTVDLFDSASGSQLEHIHLAGLADLLLVAPATANVIAKLAHGVADDALTTTALALTAPLVIAPAMNERMWLHPATQANVKTLVERGAQIVGPEFGPMACGGAGLGRLARLEVIVRRVSALFTEDAPARATEPVEAAAATEG